MTRINIIDPELLLDQHLMAEYRELPRMFTFIEQHYKGVPMDRSDTYTLNRGHMKFFYDKLEYLKKRQLALFKELLLRDYGVVFDINAFLTRYDALPSILKNDYSPTITEQLVNVERIVERFNAKPEYYTYLREKMKKADLSCFKDRPEVEPLYTTLEEYKNEKSSS